MAQVCGSIIDNIRSGKLNAKINLVVSDNPNAFALTRAKKYGIDTYVISSTSLEERDSELSHELAKYDIDLIVLAGYLKMIGPKLIEGYAIINTHPSLLPSYGGTGMYGMNVHTAVVSAKEKFSGATVHYVNSKYDEGDIISQVFVTLAENETPESLAAKVQEVEKVQLINIIKDFITNSRS